MDFELNHLCKRFFGDWWKLASTISIFLQPWILRYVALIVWLVHQLIDLGAKGRGHLWLRPGRLLTGALNEYWWLIIEFLELFASWLNSPGLIGFLIQAFEALDAFGGLCHLKQWLFKIINQHLEFLVALWLEEWRIKFF